MRRLFSILIVTGTVLAVAQAAVAELATIPITVTSQTLEVTGFGQTTGEVVGGSSVGTPWNFGNEDGSTVGSITSELIAGELIITVTGALSKGSTGGAAGLGINLLPISLGFVVPNYGTPIFLQLTKVNSELIGLAELGYMTFRQDNDPFPGAYSSQLLDGLASLGYALSWGDPPSTSLALPLLSLIPTDTVVFGWWFYRSFRVEVDNSTGISETYTIRAITYLPEPSASLTIPSGAGMLLVLAKLRGVSLIR